MSKNQIKLSDIQEMQACQQSEIINSPDNDIELARVKSGYNQEMNKRKTDIINKIDNLEKKLKKHELKEGMLDLIIGGTYAELQNLKENEFSRRGQKQTVLIKQLEALSILHDTILKYEDMIQKYQKILMDIENNKLNGFLKIENLKKEENKADDGLNVVLHELQEMFKNNSGGSPTNNILLDEIQQELNNNNY